MNKKLALIARGVLIIWVILLMGFSTISCNTKSKELSREKAAEILNKVNYGYLEGAIPVAVTEAFQMGVGEAGEASNTSYASQAEQDSRAWISKITSSLEKLKSDGFITIDIWEGPQGSRPPGFNPAQRSMVDYMYRWVQIRIDATDKLKPYIINSDMMNTRVRVIDMVFDKITGVTKTSDNDAGVEFALKPINTPLYGIVSATPSNNQMLNRSVTFRRYDDGWRLVQ
jgi:hypothetical protein